MMKYKVKPCPFNGAVGCTDTTKCNECGWNPVVAKERSAHILQDLEKRGEKNGRNHES